MLKLPSFKHNPESLSSKYVIKPGSKVKFFDPDKHDPINQTSSHLIYCCPFCESVRGRPDNDGKFYWSIEKNVGYCFKCETVGILKTDKPKYQVCFENSINRIVNSFESDSSIFESELNSMQDIPYIDLFSDMDKKAIDYIDSRNCLYSEIYKYLNMRSSNLGVAVPVIVNQKILSYCLRLYDPKGGMKYYLPKISKLLYSPEQIINTSKPVKEITLVEGTFTCIAALIDGFTHPVAIFGKFLTDLQIYLLRSLSPDIINIYLDETELSERLLNRIQDRLPTVTKFNIIRSDGSDAEEKLNWKMANYSDSYLQNLLNNISKYS